MLPTQTETMTGQLFALRPLKPLQEKRGIFYVIECFPYPQFVTDEEGITQVFDTYAAALAEASDCQQGYVITF